MGLFDTFKKTTPSKQKAASVSASISMTDRREKAIAAVIADRKIEQRILFVGVDVPWFQRIECDLLRLQPKWGCSQVSHAAQAVAALQTTTFGAIVLHAAVAADIDLLAALEKLNSAVIRVVLYSSGDTTQVARWGASGANPLPQSTDAAGLSATVSRLIRVQEWMADAGMKKLLGQCRKLPALPRLYSQVTAELSSPNGSIEVVAQCIAQDPVMTAKLLQVVNSAFFALGREVTDPTEAVMFLGAERTRSLILLAGVFTQFESPKCPGFSADQIWNHSLQVGALARTVALAETKNAKTAEAAFSAGLMHDMGKLILAANVPVMCGSIEQLHAGKKLTQREAELQVLGTTHGELAACLLGTWGLPLPVLEAVAWHHAPMRSADESFSLLTAVHVANVFAYELGRGPGTAALPEKFDHGYLDQIALGDRRNDWRLACDIPVKREEDMEHAVLRARRAAKRN